MLLIVLGVLGGFTLLVWLAVDVRRLTGGLKEAPSPQDIQRAALLLRTLAIIMGISVVGVGIWIGHFAWRVRKTDVYPPPGSRHLRTTRVVRGADAQRIARICFVLAAILFAAGLTLAPLVFELLERLGLVLP